MVFIIYIIIDIFLLFLLLWNINLNPKNSSKILRSIVYFWIYIKQLIIHFHIAPQSAYRTIKIKFHSVRKA